MVQIFGDLSWLAEAARRGGAPAPSVYRK